MLDAGGKAVPSQLAGGKLLMLARDVPGCGCSVHRVVDEPASSSPAPFSITGTTVETPFYEMTMEEGGVITRIYDKANRREVLPEGARANVLQVFEDKPNCEDAWNIDLSYQDNVWQFESGSLPALVENGPVRMVLGAKLAHGQSTIEQQIIFYAHTPRIDFVNQVDWKDRKMMLKVAFPVDILSPRATYEIAFGAIERPTHWNTSWDLARFEVSGHKWADLSEAGYGVSLMNDCKYGWDIKDNVMRLTLLRATEYPDTKADLGTHQFTYSLLPHSGDWTNRTVRAAHELNVPLAALAADKHPGRLGAEHSFLEVDAEEVIVSAVKQAEGGEDLIVRVYEAHGSRRPARITFDRPIVRAVECNLLEEDETPVSFESASISLFIKPYEIRTCKVRLKGAQ